MVPQRVSQLRPRHDSIGGAAAAYLSAEYDDCLASVYGSPDVAAVALCSRSLIRLRRETEAVQVLEAALAEKPASKCAAELLTLKGAALVSLGKHSEADAALTQARASAYNSASPALIAEAEYCTAMAHWAQGHLDDMRLDLHRVLKLSAKVEHTAADSAAPGYVGALSEVRAKAYDLLGIGAAVRENYAEQASLIQMAFEELDASPTVDKFFEARLLLNYAVLSRDLDMSESFDFVNKRLESFVFTTYTKLAEFHIRRAQGWCNAGRGNYLGAFREFRLSADAAPSTPWRIISILDKALLARELEEQHSAREALDYAMRLCKSVDWQTTPDEERNALFILAQHLAPVDAAEARRLLDRHASIKSPLPITSFANRDRRLAADLSYATAQILRAEGDSSAAISSLQDCYEVWSQIGYLSRAANVAAELAELTKSRHYVRVAQLEAEKKPASWTSARLRAIA